MKPIPKVLLSVAMDREYTRGLYRGIARYSHDYGPWDFLIGPGNRNIGIISQWKPDGIITHDADDLEKLQAEQVPLIASTLTEDLPRFNVIKPNNEQIVCMAVEHLVEKGFIEFGCCGFQDRHYSIERCRLFTEKMKERGHKTHVFLRPNQNYLTQWHKEEELASDWVQSLPKPIAIFACDDHYGRYISRMCKIAKIPVPEQAAILGVDNDDLVCELSDPPLSSIALNTEKAGYQAAALLDQLMAGEKKTLMRIEVAPTNIVPRQSTDILAIEDTELAKAINFIRTNTNIPIQVGDVVARTHLSRRSLYHRFNTVLGRSIHDEILRARIEKVANQLLETDMTISQIAFKMGSSDKHIARCFRQVKGMSPKEYRKKHAP